MTTGTQNAGFGAQTLNKTTTGYNNTAMGTAALYNNTTGYQNTAIGNIALLSNTTAFGNTAVGYQAGNGITTGSSNVYIGYAAIQSSVAVTGEIVVGASIIGKGSNTGFISPGGGGVYQGNNSSTWSTTSDQRLKKNIVDNTVGLSAINAIQVRNFEYRLPEEVTEIDSKNAIDIKGVQLGAIAQELQAILPDCVKEESTGVLSVDTSNLTWHLINAVKELSAKVTALEAKLGA